MTPRKEEDITDFNIYDATGGGTANWNLTVSGTDTYHYPDPARRAKELELDKKPTSELLDWLHENPRDYSVINETRDAYELEIMNRFPFSKLYRKIGELRTENYNLKEKVKSLKRQLLGHGHVGGEVMEKMK